LFGLLQPAYGVREISLFEVRKPEIVGSIGKRWLGRGLAQVSDRPVKILAVDIESSEIVQKIRVIPYFATNQFELLSRLIGLVLLEKRDPEREPRPQYQSWING